MSEWTITGIPAPHVDGVWSTVEPLIAKALAKGRGEFIPADYRRFLLAREMQLWAAVKDQQIHAVCLTEIVNFPRLKICRLVLAAGSEMRHWMKPGVATIKAWAKANGCEEIRGGGRMGWSRALGWKPIYTVCGERLTEN